ncbi:MAG: SDR family oxidoreductase [Alphaproteobacteria bacterium]|nr:SDR family oxidoreductase [Alphaproteobacteria bacterium]
MDLLIKGRRALVTGASLGIGRAVAEELAREGCDVALVARTESALRQAATEIARVTNRRVVPIAADASQEQDVARAVEQAVAALGGPIDILVNNAGSTPEDGIDRVDFAKWQYSVALKQFGYARFIQAVLPAMRAQKWGRIVNVIGRSGHQPRPVYLAGGAVNAGLLSFTKGLAEDCAKDNVLVTGVNPGPIDTPRWRTLREAAERTRGVTAAQFDGLAVAGVPLGRLGTSEECAAVIVFLCSERASYVTGEIVNIDGGGTRCI